MELKEPELPYSDEEIMLHYKGAKNKRRAITILSHMNCCSKDTIEMIVQQSREEKDAKTVNEPKTAPKAAYTSADEYARKLGVRVDYVYKRLRKGKIKGAIKDDRAWRIPVDSLEKKAAQKSPSM